MATGLGGTGRRVARARVARGAAAGGVDGERHGARPASGLGRGDAWGRSREGGRGGSWWRGGRGGAAPATVDGGRGGAAPEFGQPAGVVGKIRARVLGEEIWRS